MAISASATTLAAVEPRTFREVLGRFATGVAFVTAAPGGRPDGLIVNSLTSVSADPPMVAFCPARSSLTWQRMRRTGHFGVNVLGREHESFTRRATPPGADRFAGIDWEFGAGGAPLLNDALATIECGIIAEHAAGDHSIVVGLVEALGAPSAGQPLVFFGGAFATLG